ncbi:MAG: response regulator [Pseudomonadota bacterium]
MANSVSNTSGSGPVRGHTPNVLCVDDDPLVRLVLAKQLRAHGLTVETTEDASSFLTRLVEDPGRFDLAIVDLSLPGMNGEEIISWLGSSDEEALTTLPLIVLTGSTVSPGQLKAAPGQVTRVIQKPYQIPDLMAAIADCLSPQKRRGRTQGNP